MCTNRKRRGTSPPKVDLGLIDQPNFIQVYFNDQEVAIVPFLNISKKIISNNFPAGYPPTEAKLSSGGGYGNVAVDVIQTPPKIPRNVQGLHFSDYTHHNPQDIRQKGNQDIPTNTHRILIQIPTF